MTQAATTHTFVTGTFVKYRAAQKIHLGKLARDLPEGEVVEFDGTTFKWGGEAFQMPELRSIIKADWLELVAPAARTARGAVAAPAKAGPAVKPADGARGVVARPMAVEREERSVASPRLQPQNQARVQAAPSGMKVEAPRAFNPAVVAEDDGDERSVGSALPRTAGTARAVPAANPRTAGAQVPQVQAQDSLSVGSFKDVRRGVAAGAAAPVAGRGVTAGARRASLGDAEPQEGVSVGRVLSPTTSGFKLGETLPTSTGPEPRVPNRPSVLLDDKRRVHAAAADSVEEIIGALDSGGQRQLAAGKLQDDAVARRAAERRAQADAAAAAVAAEEALDGGYDDGGGETFVEVGEGVGEPGGFPADGGDPSTEEVSVQQFTFAQRRAILAERLRVLEAEADALEAEEAATAAPVPAAAPAAAPAPTLKPREPRTVEEYVTNGDNVEIAPGLWWDKKLHWKIRGANAIKLYGDQPEKLALVREYEVPSVRAFIDEALAKRAR